MTDDKKPQIDKFKDAARELECDDDDQRFDKRLKKLVRHKPVDDMAHARAELAKIDAQIARLDAGKPAHVPNDSELRSSFESQRRTWLAVLGAPE